MFFYISKILGFFCQPIVWVFIILVFSFFTKNPKRKKKSFLIGLIVLYFFSNKAIFHEVTSLWEAEPVNMRTFNTEYEVAVVLGGIVSMDRKHKLVEFQANSDRFLNVLPLYFKGQVKKILISGGTGRVYGEEEEATILQSYLVKIGVKKEDILIEVKSRNTYENAKFSAELLSDLGIESKILLSTSSTHMYRSALCFKKQGVNFDTFPVDQVSYNRELTPDTLFIPNAKTLQNWYDLIHEWLGIVSYKIAGYI
ncbi:MAG: YdcF family protein [Bacteroidetes bacterium]|nr:MAG: YdcF family protein [Bacteroidota bacterium]MBL1145069.1 YdcF family protein [Bacteroidota bacterium]NOG57866.1 YdcF family protein [Bacteroidota bacterium]